MPSRHKFDKFDKFSKFNKFSKFDKFNKLLIPAAMRQALIDVSYMFDISTVSVGVDDTALLKRIIIVVPQTPGLR